MAFVTQHQRFHLRTIATHTCAQLPFYPRVTQFVPAHSFYWFIPLTYIDYLTAHSGAGRQWSLQPAAATPVYPIFICSLNLEQSMVDRKSQYVTAARCIPVAETQSSHLFRSVVHTDDVVCPTVCPDDWAHIESSCYKAWQFEDTADRSWTTARDHCVTRGGDLVSISDVNENMMVNVVRRVRAINRKDAKYKLYLCILYIFSPSHASASTLHSVPAWIMTCQCCFLSSAISVVIWFLAVSSFTRSRLSFGLPCFRFPSTVICNIFLVV